MEQFEYKTMLYELQSGFFNTKVERNELDNMLNWMGAQGWELVSAVSIAATLGDTIKIACIFKRRCVYEEGAGYGSET